MSNHRLTVEEQLAGAKRALMKLEQKVKLQPRYRGLLEGMKRNVARLEEKVHPG
jgi:hypothetical protein